MADFTPIACSLDAKELPARSQAIEALGERLLAVDAGGRRATLEFEPGSAADVADFVRAESRCCPFFGFRQVETAATVRLEIDVPEGGEWALRGLVAGFVSGWKALV